MSLRKTSKAGSSASLPTISEEKSKKAAMEAQLATSKPPLPSIRGIIAARILSHKIKEKSERLAAIRRRRGDTGEFSLTHAFSPEDETLHKQHDKQHYHKEESFLSILTHTTSTGNMEPSRLFPISRVQAIIKHVLEEHFGDRDYDQAYCSHLTPKIADIIKEKVKKIYLPRYKIIAHVITGQIDGQTVRMASRCAWDKSHDNYAEYMYKNYKMYAIGIVYGVYCE